MEELGTKPRRICDCTWSNQDAPALLTTLLGTSLGWPECQNGASVNPHQDRVPGRGVTGGGSQRSPARAGPVSWQSPEG